MANNADVSLESNSSDGGIAAASLTQLRGGGAKRVMLHISCRLTPNDPERDKRGSRGICNQSPVARIQN